uniref:Bis(monoacylglycero)phosphate synthase CLN5 n=1 Tax=Oryzias sinensis TaxID=183150 RepID=A0A8C7YAV8_9TELE
MSSTFCPNIFFVLYVYVSLMLEVDLFFCWFSSSTQFSSLGSQFNHMAQWVQDDNRTGIYYETWTVRSDPAPNSTVWFESYDCSQFVHRAYRKLKELGAKLSSRSPTYYTKIYLYSGEPTYLGNDSAIFGTPALQNLAADIRKFYFTFRPHQSFVDFAFSLLEAYKKIVLDKTFYLYYNFEYWHLPMKYPYMQIVYEEVPLFLKNRWLENLY